MLFQIGLARLKILCADFARSNLSNYKYKDLKSLISSNIMKSYLLTIMRAKPPISSTIAYLDEEHTPPTYDRPVRPDVSGVLPLQRSLLFKVKNNIEIH